MISMDFLSKRVAGTEFIDFQNGDFYSDLKEVLKEHITDTEDGPVLGDNVADQLKTVMAKYTGFSNITLKFTETDNLSVDVGYFSPGHVLNNAGVEVLLRPTQTTLYRWFLENKSKVFKGGVDYKTGRVTGSFCTIPVDLSINVNLSRYFPTKKTQKFDVPIEGILAGGIAHELGHVWSGCMMLATVLEDNLVAQTALRQYRNAQQPEDRVVVLKDTATLLGLGPTKGDELVEFAKNSNDETFMLYYTKLVSQRNNQRALSVGVTEMTAEVVADMYAIRMGCDKGVIAAIGTLVDRGVIVPMLENFMGSCAVAAMMMYFTMFPVVLFSGAAVTIPIVGGITFSLALILGYFSRGYSGIYNADHRRMDDALRQLIAKLKDNRKLPSKEKAELIDDINKLLEVTKKLRPWYDGTGLYRLMGWVFSGSDFKLKEIEHFTQVLNNNEINVLSEQLKGV